MDLLSRLTQTLSSRMIMNDASKYNLRPGHIVLAALMCMLIVSEAVAQRTGTTFAFDSKFMYVGEYAKHYTSGGALSPEGPWASDLFPAWHRYTQNLTGNAIWVSAKDFTGPNDVHWDAYTAHVGYYTSGVGEVYPQSVEMFSRLDPPIVYVDGLETTNYPVIYEHGNVDTLRSDAMVVSVTNTPLGITVTKKAYAFAQEFHDDYHIIETILTNTGELEEGQTLPPQTLSDVWFTEIRTYAVNSQGGSIIGNGAGYGRNTMDDVVGDGAKEYDTDFRAQYSWRGYEPGFTQWNGIGAPALRDNFSLILEGDSLGRLTADNFVGFVTLHADRSATDPSDDPAQPAVAGFINNGSPLLSSDPGNPEKIAQEYAIFEDGVIEDGAVGSHLDFIVGPPGSTPEPASEWRTRAASQRADPGADGNEGFDNITAYGPYTLEPGQSVRIVVAEAAAGLSDVAALEIGKSFKAAHGAGDENRIIEFDADGNGQIEADEAMNKNEWVMTSRDSLFQTFRRARANYESGFDIPQPPLPPRTLNVTSGPDKITLTWDMYPNAQHLGFELYRAANRVEGDYSGYDLIESFGPEVTSYEDEGVQRGVAYYYYLQAVGPDNEDATGMTPTGIPLRSGRAFAQTYDPARLSREPGTGIEAALVVPNPYIISSESDVRWPDQRDRIGFLEIPGNCTIKIFNELGELIETIEHTNGSGDDFWDLTTSSNQLVVSGIYMAVIKDSVTGEQVIRKFVVIR